MAFVALVAVAGLLTMAEPAVPLPCSVVGIRHNPEGYFWPADSIRQFVATSTLIVRAKVEGDTSWTWRDSPERIGQPAVRFRIVEVLQGSATGSTLVLPGVLVPDDDFNTGAVPYRIVRRAGQSGDCFARKYKPGAEYLLLLQRGGIGWTPHWKPLAPMNEQLRPADDPWLAWVRAAIPKPPGRAP